MEAQCALHHRLNLTLVRPPVARDAELELEGGGFQHGNALEREREEDHPARLRDRDRRAGVHREEQSLDDGEIRSRLREELPQVPLDFLETLGDGGRALGSDDKPLAHGDVMDGRRLDQP